MPLAEIEMRVIHETLRHTRGDKRLTAKLLGIATRTIYRKLDRGSDGSLAIGEAGLDAALDGGLDASVDDESATALDDSDEGPRHSLAARS